MFPTVFATNRTRVLRFRNETCYGGQEDQSVNEEYNGALLVRRSCESKRNHVVVDIPD